VTRRTLRFWVPILIQSVLCIIVVLAAVWLLILGNALLHPPVDYTTVQLPTP